MKLILDFLPIVVFYGVFKLANIYIATGAAIAVTLVLLAWTKLSGRPIELMQWAGLVIIVVFGGATLYLQDETFIKWKPTVLYLLLALGLGLARLRGKNVLATMMKNQLILPEPIWNRLSAMWAGFLIAMAILNLTIAYSFDTETWVNFKMFGSMGLTFVFVLLQAVYVNRHIQETPTQAIEPSITKGG